MIVTSNNTEFGKSITFNLDGKTPEGNLGINVNFHEFEQAAEKYALTVAQGVVDKVGGVVEDWVDKTKAAIDDAIKAEGTSTVDYTPKEDAPAPVETAPIPTSSSEQPPVDNAHVAEGAEQFTPEVIEQNAPATAEGDGIS